MTPTSSFIVQQRQAPLRRAYREDPRQAMITKHATTSWTGEDGPLNGTVVPGDAYGTRWPYGIDRAVGGLHDAPNPGEMLCAALAACADSTARMVADLLAVTLVRVDVDVTGEVDVRGSLAIDPATPVGLQHMRCRVWIEAAPGTPSDTVARLRAAAERSCVTLQTLRAGLPVDYVFETRDTPGAAL
jgi:uncharacterized OsmC-like protein